jgi:hypothetical protein
MFERSHKRVSRYRKLALIESDRARANLLQRLADEAERGVLCMAPHALAVRPVRVTQSSPFRARPDWSSK